MTTRAQIIETARLLLDPVTPFQHGQCAPGVGIDCVNVLAWVARQLGLPAPDKLQPYSKQPSAREFRAQLRKHMDPLAGVGVAGDVLTFSFVVTHHIAIVTSLEPLTILHAYEPYGKVYEHPVNDWWDKRSREWWAFRGLE